MRLGRSKWFTDMRAELLQRVEAPPARLIRRDGVGLHPSAASELIEIHARIGAAVDGSGIESGSSLAPRSPW